MSEEFIITATNEIKEDILEIKDILKYCKKNSDFYLQVHKIQKHTHNIKGLAALINKNDLGLLASSLDSILRKITNEIKFDGLFELTSNAIIEMENSMIFSNYNLEEIKGNVSKFASNI